MNNTIRSNRFTALLLSGFGQKGAKPVLGDFRKLHHKAKRNPAEILPSSRRHPKQVRVATRSSQKNKEVEVLIQDKVVVLTVLNKLVVVLVVANRLVVVVLEAIWDAVLITLLVLVKNILNILVQQMLVQVEKK